MLELRGAGVRWPDGTLGLRGLDLTLGEGRRLVVAGPSGSGKSTLLRLLAGLVEPTAGEIAAPGVPPPTAFIPQRPGSHLVAATVAEEIAFPLERQARSQKRIRERVREVLELFDLEELADRSPGRLSGGEMQRVAFAVAWATSPRLWLLDEPAAYLDPLAREELYALIGRIPADSALVLAASGPREWGLGEELLLLRGGSAVVQGPPAELLEGEVLSRAGLALPRRLRLERAGERAPEAREEPAAAGLREPVPPTAVAVDSRPPRPSAPALRAKDLRARRASFLGPAREVLRGVDLDAQPGELIALVGPSGAGKSTLLEVLAGLLPLSGGGVSWGGGAPEEWRGRIGFAFQHPERSFFSATVLDEVAWGPRNLAVEKAEAEERAREGLHRFGLEPTAALLRRSPFDLSGGEARRVALASVWALRPEAWLLDEPTAGLDESSASLVARVLRDEAAGGALVLLAGHDLDLLGDLAPRWVLLRDGVVERDGDPRSWWAGGPGQDLWPPPETVRVWREAGRPVERLPRLDEAGTLRAIRAWDRGEL